MRKRFIQICALGLGVVLALAGCSTPSGSGSGAPPANPPASTGASASSDVNEDGTVNNPENVQVDPNKLVLWSLFSGGDGGFMDKIIADYNATNPKKQVQSVMLVWADYYTKLTTAVATGKGPDIGISHISKLPELVANGVVQPIDTYTTVAGTNWADYPTASNDGVTFDGQHYAIPLDTHAEIMYANKDIIDKAKIPLDANGQLTIKNSDDFINILKTLKASVGEGNTALSITQQGDDPYRVWWATYFQMGGTPMVSDDGTTVTMDKAIAVKAADFVNSLYTEGYVQPGIVDHQKMFQEGKAGLLFAGTWATGAFEQTSGLNFVPHLFPSLFNGSEAAWADSHVLIIPTKESRSAEDTQAAVDFINYVSSKGALTWAGSGQIPASSTVTTSQDFLSLPYRASYLHEKDVAVLPAKNEHFYALKDTMIKNLDTIWSSQATSQAAIDNMFNEMGADLV